MKLTKRQVDRIGDVTIGIVLSLILAFFLFLMYHGCSKEPGGSSVRVCPPLLAPDPTGFRQLTEGDASGSRSSSESVEVGGCGVGAKHDIESCGPHKCTRQARKGRGRSPTLAKPEPTGQPPASSPVAVLTGDPLRSRSLVRVSGPVHTSLVLSRAGKLRFVLDMLRMHESIDGTCMVGDGGLAQGWLHQHKDHWQEGCERLGVDWPWPEDTHDLKKCETVAIGYWHRYARKYLEAGDVEELIRRFRLPFAPHHVDNDVYLTHVLVHGDKL